MTAIPADMFAVAPARTRRVGRVLEALLGTLWRMKLIRDGFRDAETRLEDRPRKPDVRTWRRGQMSGRKHYGYYSETVVVGLPSDEFAADSEQRREFYRYISQGRWAIRDPKDRRIADALADGASYRDIMRRQRVGQFRIERVLFTLVNGRKEPWHWRTGNPREKSGQKMRARLSKRRRRASIQP